MSNLIEFSLFTKSNLVISAGPNNPIMATRRTGKLKQNSSLSIYGVSQHLRRLTERERQVLNLVTKGYSNRRISEKLGVAYGTLLRHRNNINRRLGAGVSQHLHRLTERERQVLSFVANGYTSKQIGKKLGIHYRTVETHRINIGRRIGVRNVAQAVRYAIKNGLVSIPKRPAR